MREGGKSGKDRISFPCTERVVRVGGSSGRDLRPQEEANRNSSAGGREGRTPIGQPMQPRSVRVSGRAGRAVIGLWEMSNSFSRLGRDVVISVIWLLKITSVSRESGRVQSNTLRPTLSRVSFFRALY